MRTLLIDVWKRLTPWSKSADVYANDTDNAYPERMDRLVNNSVTAKSAASIMVQYLIGKGYGTDADSIIINKEKNLKLIDFADDVADDLVKQRGVFIHINWNALYQIADCSVVPYEWCRIGKKDSNDYAGKIAISKEWLKPKRSDIELVDVYNPRKAVIEAQVEKAGGWEHYKGQILFINMDTKLIYPLSRIDPVSEDCDSEAQASIYKNKLLRKGFFGNTLVVTRPLVGEGLEPGSTALTEAESERERFQQAIKDSLGAQNTGGVLCLEMDFAGEKLDDAILIKQIESKIDDKLFNYTETSVRENILVAFNNLPAGLIKTNDSALFGNSGEAIREMKRTYWENTSKERSLLTSVINQLLERSQDYASLIVEPLKLIDDATPDNP
ncbi:hypothetical protein Q765_14930 [Flavobacterium rivuli WB 3.3-2 = DSM 21788]|uniref:Portal protein n=1 Tax=Flavobacterium rivuli WB 3.3-2 = DSM 21788 TaxID=1121895 RepID=A0A0A2M2Q4_9FLAO|nr:hypothetical protein [Flavobacterium rivuli]KGO85713.1 hypothetical protein Q765_14930 [Flavobacterium rivuli WB 3.3-2 = DSM 21788]